MAQLINYGVNDWDNGWRLSLGLAAVPASVLTLGGILLPESPNSLIERFVHYSWINKIVHYNPEVLCDLWQKDSTKSKKFTPKMFSLL